jgi:hypothetical protein
MVLKTPFRCSTSGVLLIALLTCSAASAQQIALSTRTPSTSRDKFARDRILTKSRHGRVQAPEQPCRRLWVHATQAIRGDKRFGSRGLSRELGSARGIPARVVQIDIELFQSQWDARRSCDGVIHRLKAGSPRSFRSKGIDILVEPFSRDRLSHGGPGISPAENQILEAAPIQGRILCCERGSGGSQLGKTDQINDCDSGSKRTALSDPMSSRAANR